jgi:hypothetical protein
MILHVIIASTLRAPTYTWAVLLVAPQELQLLPSASILHGHEVLEPLQHTVGHLELRLQLACKHGRGDGVLSIKARISSSSPNTTWYTSCLTLLHWCVMYCLNQLKLPAEFLHISGSTRCISIPPAPDEAKIAKASSDTAGYRHWSVNAGAYSDELTS